MSQFNEGVARQVEVEQAHVSAMYGLLDDQLVAVRGELAAVLKSSADSAGEVYARDVAAERLSRQLRRLDEAEPCFRAAGPGIRDSGTTGAVGRAWLPLVRWTLALRPARKRPSA